MQQSDDRGRRGISRRHVLGAGAAAGAGLAAAAAVPASPAAAAPAAGGTVAPGVAPVPSGPPATTPSGPLRASGLRAGWRTDPLGIGADRPELSWLVSGDGSDRRQTAYQIRVASSEARLRRGPADLWDSGRVSSGESTRIAYGGRPLGSRDRAVWQVRCWDERGRPSAWSASASFEVGLLEPSDWTASWIGHAAWDALVAPVPPAVLTFPAATGRYVRLVVTRLGLPLQEGWPEPVSRLQLAELEVVDSANPDSDLALHGAVEASSVYSAPGSWEPEYLTDGKTDGASAPIGYTSLQFDDQDISATPITVTVDLGASRSFDTVRLYPRTDTRTADGRTANFPENLSLQVADVAGGPYRTVSEVTGLAAPEPAAVPDGLPLFARQFRVRGSVAQARLYITGLGAYQATVNSQPVSTAVLEPGNTTYRRHLDYATYDVTHLLRRGDNAIGVEVGTGIYDTLTYGSRYTKFQGRIGAPKLLAQLEIRYADGTRDVVATGPDWRAALGPTTFSNWYGGEDFDARRLPAGWNGPGADLSRWDPVSASAPPDPGTVLTARSGPAVEPVQTLTAKSVTQPAPGVYVFDFGTNVAGWQQLAVTAPAGTRVTMRPAELLHPDGTIDYGSTGNPIYDVYTCAGTGTETWHPRFIYHGFRYLQLEGLPAAPTADTVRIAVLRAANPPAGSFDCSNDLLNDVHRIIDRAVQSNMFSVLTDCPTREKLGWMEQNHLNFDTVARNYDIAAYGRDLVAAMADAQLDNGLVPDIAPEYTVFSGGFRDDPNWGNSMVLVPWSLYRTYGDREVLATYYPNMRRYVDYLTSRANGNLLDYGLGDWGTINASTPTGVTATYGYFRAVDGLAAIAAVLGEQDDATRYGQLRDAIGAAFHAKYYDATNHTYAGGTQAADALALQMGVVPADLRDGVLGHLVANLAANGYHLNLGEIGLPALFDALWSAGRDDVIYQIATQTTAPSYGAMLARGATSLTEFWDGSGSQNHFMLGAIEKWFSYGLGGIDQAPGSAGYTDLVIAPAIVGDLSRVAARYDTPLGPVASAWRRDGDTVTLDVTVPVGATAAVRLPGLAEAKVGSGDHRFTAVLAG